MAATEVLVPARGGRVRRYRGISLQSIGMYIFRPSRFLLNKRIAEASPYIRGKTLDIGAGGFDRYGGSFPLVTEYIRMDIKGADIVGSIYDIPFEENTFDSLVSTQVFEHLAHPQKGALEMHRVLKKGGHALVTVPQWNELHEEPHDYFRYTRYGLESLFAEAGFTIVSITRVGGYYSTLAQMKIRFLLDKYHLHERPLLGRIASKLFSAYGQYMIAKDTKDESKANQKHAIGWCAVIQK